MADQTMNPRLSLRRKLALASATLGVVLLVALVVGLAARGNTPDDSAVAGAVTESAADDRSQGEGGHTTDDGAETELSGGEAIDLDLSVVERAPAGEYLYDVVTEIQGASRTAQRKVTVTLLGDVDGETLQEVANIRGGRQDEWRWTDGGVVVTVTHFGAGVRCEWGSRWVLYPLPTEIGTSWDTAADCKIPEGEEHRASMSESARVVGVRARRVAGETVGVVVVERRRTEVIRRKLQNGGILEFRAEDTITEEFSPEHGLIVRSRMDTRRTGVDGIVESTETITLTSLRPQ